MVRPGIAAAALLAFIFAWNNYVFPLILADTNAGTVTVAITKFLGGGGQAYYNLTAAAAIIAALPPLILALTIQRYLVRGLSFGAVKAGWPPCQSQTCARRTGRRSPSTT
jgi:multiple sugar transport system permease protein